MITPIKDSILFQFDDEVRDGRFYDYSSSGIILGASTDGQVKATRWGTVVAVGPEVDVSTGITVGAHILIEPMGWTADVTSDGVRVWRTDEAKVLAVED
jgi:co-chaperonin GroES (HSP10)